MSATDNVSRVNRVSRVIVISDRDNVATALESLVPGETIHAGEVAVAVLEPVPRGHKLALRQIRAGEPVVKYGSAIGTASATIAPGAHVHIHNVASGRGRGDLMHAGRGDLTHGASAHEEVAPEGLANEARIAEPLCDTGDTDDTGDVPAREPRPA